MTHHHHENIQGQHHCASCHHEHGHCASCCHDESCELHHHHHEHEDFAHQLIEIADQAWMEVLTDKIIQQIEGTSGKNLEELAKLVVESNKTRWKHKLGLQKNVNEFKEKVAEFFNKE